MIRVRIQYSDAAESVETWPSAYRDRDAALKFADVMDTLHSGVIRGLHVEVSCPAHGWHAYDDSFCDRCGDEVCALDRFEDEREGSVCSECSQQIEEDRDGECGCGSYCSDCTGIAAHGPI